MRTDDANFRSALATRTDIFTAFEDGYGERVKARADDSTKEGHAPFYGAMLAGQPGAFSSAVSSADVSNGFLGRLMVLKQSLSRSKRYYEGRSHDEGSVKPPYELATWVERYRERLHVLSIRQDAWKHPAFDEGEPAGRFWRIEFSSEGETVRREIIDWFADLESDHRDSVPLLATIYRRSAEMVARTAAILAATSFDYRDPSAVPTIEPQHLLWALRQVEISVDNVGIVVHDAEDSPLEQGMRGSGPCSPSGGSHCQ